MSHFLLPCSIQHLPVFWDNEVIPYIFIRFCFCRLINKKNTPRQMNVYLDSLKTYTEVEVWSHLQMIEIDTSLYSKIGLIIWNRTTNSKWAVPFKDVSGNRIFLKFVLPDYTEIVLGLLSKSLERSLHKSQLVHFWFTGYPTFSVCLHT